MFFFLCRLVGSSCVCKLQLKLVVSGSWESALLKLTWPDDFSPDEDLVREQIECLQGGEEKRQKRKLWERNNYAAEWI